MEKGKAFFILMLILFLVILSLSQFIKTVPFNDNLKSNFHATVYKDSKVIEEFKFWTFIETEREIIFIDSMQNKKIFDNMEYSISVYQIKK